LPYIASSSTSSSNGNHFGAVAAAAARDGLWPGGTASSISGGNEGRGYLSLAGCSCSSWTCIDLSFNSLEGGSALCAATIITGIIAQGACCLASIASGKGLAQPGVGKQQQQQRETGVNQNFFLSHQDSRDSGDLAAQSSSCGHGEGSLSKDSPQQPGLCCRTLAFDGNPLGAAGLRCIMRALAGQPVVGGLPSTPGGHQQSIAGARSSTAAKASCTTVHPASAPGSVSPGGAAPSGGVLQPCEEQTMLVHVSIAKVAIMAKEKGFRSSLRADYSGASSLNAQASSPHQCMQQP